MKRKKLSLLFGLIGSVLGTALVLFLLVYMNQQLGKMKQEEAETVSKIDVIKKEKPKKKKAAPKPKPKPKKARKPAPAPMVGLGSGLSGLSFGLPGFDNSDLDLGDGLFGDKDGDVVMTGDSVDNPPKPIMQSPMRYPSRAKAQGVTGYVTLSLLISPTGQVEKVKVVEAQPSGVFEETAVAGVKTWKFEPASYKGESVRVWATQTVRFDLS